MWFFCVGGELFRTSVFLQRAVKPLPESPHQHKTLSRPLASTLADEAAGRPRFACCQDEVSALPNGIGTTDKGLTSPLNVGFAGRRSHEPTEQTSDPPRPRAFACLRTKPLHCSTSVPQKPKYSGSLPQGVAP